MTGWGRALPVLAIVLSWAMLVVVARAAEPSGATTGAAPAKTTGKKSGGAKGGNAAGGGAKRGTAKRTLTPAEAAAAVVSGPEVRNFRQFCDEWMQKLRDREIYNKAHVTWDTKEGRVSGEYVAYGTESSCTAHEEPGKDPIGKITYREMRYRCEGATPAEALGRGTILEQTDVTEIFRYGKGRWQY